MHRRWAVGLVLSELLSGRVCYTCEKKEGEADGRCDVVFTV